MPTLKIVVGFPRGTPQKIIESILDEMEDGEQQDGVTIVGRMNPTDLLKALYSMGGSQVYSDNKWELIFYHPETSLGEETYLFRMS